MNHNIELQNNYSHIVNDYCEEIYMSIIRENQLEIEKFLSYPDYLHSTFLRYWISKEDKINPRSLFNFPIQAHGSEMLRLALIGLVKEDIEVNALIHDGIIVQCKSNKYF